MLKLDRFHAPKNSGLSGTHLYKYIDTHTNTHTHKCIYLEYMIGYRQIQQHYIQQHKGKSFNALYCMLQEHNSH